MSRIYSGYYADRAYARVRRKLDREAQQKGGCHANGCPLVLKLPSSQHEPNDVAACRQLDDATWFDKFPRASVRLRELRDDDATTPESRESFLLAVMRSGRRAFLYKWAGAETQ